MSITKDGIKVAKVLHHPTFPLASLAFTQIRLGMKTMAIGAIDGAPVVENDAIPKHELWLMGPRGELIRRYKLSVNKPK